VESDRVDDGGQLLLTPPHSAPLRFSNSPVRVASEQRSDERNIAHSFARECRVERSACQQGGGAVPRRLRAVQAWRRCRSWCAACSSRINSTQIGVDDELIRALVNRVVVAR